MKKVLIACEASQVICTAFRNGGFEAYSCDLQDCYGGHPEWHLKMDALAALRLMDWSLVVAHPPCTYLSAAGANSMYRAGEMVIDRCMLSLKAAVFFLRFFSDYSGKLAVENPRPLLYPGLPKYTQVICPTDFGHEYTKRTCLWLRDLPPLLPTHGKYLNARSWLNHVSSNPNRRARSFEGIAQAMVEQWGPLL